MRYDGLWAIGNATWDNDVVSAIVSIVSAVCRWMLHPRGPGLLHQEALLHPRWCPVLPRMCPRFILSGRGLFRAKILNDKTLCAITQSLHVQVVRGGHG